MMTEPSLATGATQIWLCISQLYHNKNDIQKKYSKIESKKYE